MGEETKLWANVNIALAMAGVALMVMAGDAAFAQGYEPVATLIGMLAVAVALQTVGWRGARALPEKVMLGIDRACGEETRSDEVTTRGPPLAAMPLRSVPAASAPVTVTVNGEKHPPGRAGRCTQSEAPREAVAAGATVLHHIREDAGREAGERSRRAIRNAGPSTSHPRPTAPLGR